MTEKKLGKGLDSIFGANVKDILDDIQNGRSSEHASTPIQIPIDQIRPNPYQPRKVFNETALQELSQSIALHGVFTPILIRKSISGYDLVAGERRWRASQMAGLSEIPAILVDFTEEQMMEISLLENIQREDLNAIEEARAYENLIRELHYTQEMLAKRVGKSREHVSNTMRLLKLPSGVQNLVMEQKLSMGHVRCLLALKDDREIESVAQVAMMQHMSVRALEHYVKALIERKKNNQLPPESRDRKPDSERRPSRGSGEFNTDFYKLALEESLKLPVEIKNRQVCIHYRNKSELLELVNRLRRNDGQSQLPFNLEEAEEEAQTAAQS